MTAQRLIIAGALSAALFVGSGAAVATAGSNNDMPANCFGQHVSMMARMHGGMASATAHHNEMHHTDLSVGEHQTHIRNEMCGR